MGLFDKIKKSVSETVDNVSKFAEQTVNDTKNTVSDVATKIEKTYADIAPKIGEGAAQLYSAGVQGASDAALYVGEAVTEAVDGDYSKLQSMASATGDFVMETAKDMTGINAYNHYQAAKASRVEAENIAHRVEDEVGKVRYLANNRLQYMGETRQYALKNTVGRFIFLLDRMKQHVRDKEYEMFTQIDMTKGELKEMETIALDQKKMSSILATGVAAATTSSIVAKKLAIYGVQKLATSSSGTAIKNLSGAAAQKATLTWLGGGPVSLGGGGIAVGTARLAAIGKVASGILILTTAAEIASIYYSMKNTEATQYLADVKIWEAKTMAACELMKHIVRRSDEIATLTTRLETRCTDALDSLEEIVDSFDPDNVAHVTTFQKAAILVKSTSQLCQTPLIDQNGEMNAELDALTLSSEKILNKNL